MTNEQKQQFTRRITQANRTELSVILYEMLVTYLEEAQTALQKEDQEAFHAGIRHARACLHELILSLHYEYALAGNLLQLYLYAERELIRADARLSEEPISHAKHIMCKLHDAYNKISDQDQSTPVMENTQTVYAGLTYGKTDLNESLSGSGESRGFRV